MRRLKWVGTVWLVTLLGMAGWGPRAQAQQITSCSPTAPAVISGSTGAQGVLDPTNTDPTQGLVWPTGANKAFVFMDTGQVEFFSPTSSTFSPHGLIGFVGSATLPGVSGTLAFPDGRMNFINVHLPAGTTVQFTTTLPGLPPPVILLSCQDVILDAGSSVGASPENAIEQFANPGPRFGPGSFGGANTVDTVSIPPGGFGPRSGSFPAAGSLYPAIGGAGGNAAAGSGLAVAGGGPGGAAFVISAAQRVTINGTILAYGFNGAVSNSAVVTQPAQGGAGGSVRLAAVLVDGIGTINTSAGKDSDGVVRGPSGPIEIQGFVQNLFSEPLTGSATSCTTNKNCAVATPLPSNLPAIAIVGVSVGGQPSCGPGSQIACSNTGSLVAPDVQLPAAATVQSVTVTARVDFQKCVEQASVPALTLAFRAVGTDGSAQDKSANAVLGTSCTTAAQTAGVLDVTAAAVVNLTPGVTYQVVVTPTTVVAVPTSLGPTLLRSAAGSEPVIRAAPVLGGSEGTHSTSSGQTVSKRDVETSDREQLLERWSRLFGVESPTGKRVARLSVAVGE